MFCQIGTSKFEKLNTPSSWNTDYEWTWADQARIAGKPASQAIAPQLQSHSVAGVFDSSFCDVDAAIAKLKDDAEAMLPVAFFTGDEFVSKVTIRKLGITRRVMTKTGGLDTVEFSLDLKEYVDTEKRKDDTPWD